MCALTAVTALRSKRSYLVEKRIVLFCDHYTIRSWIRSRCGIGEGAWLSTAKIVCAFNGRGHAGNGDEK